MVEKLHGFIQLTSSNLRKLLFNNVLDLQNCAFHPTNNTKPGPDIIFLIFQVRKKYLEQNKDMQ